MFSYDLALLKLKGTVSFSPFVIPICIPDDINDLVGKNGWITGWGAQYGKHLQYYSSYCKAGFEDSLRTGVLPGGCWYPCGSCT